MSPPLHGEVWWCEPPDIGRRPVVVLSRDAAIARRSRVLVAPCTTTFRGLPSEVELVPATDPVPRPCVATLDAVQSVPVSLLVDRLGRLSQARLQDICAALAVAVDCPASLGR